MTMTDEERELLAALRELPPDDQDLIRKVIRRIAELRKSLQRP